MVPFSLKVLAKFGVCSNCSQNLDECSLSRARKHKLTARMLRNARKDHAIPLVAVETSNFFFSRVIRFLYTSVKYAHCSTMLLVLGSSQQLNAESDWLIAARAFTSPLLCHKAKHFIRKQRNVLLAVSFRALYFCLKSSAWTVKMGLAWSSYKSKRKEKKTHKR